MGLVAVEAEIVRQTAAELLESIQKQPVRGLLRNVSRLDLLAAHRVPPQWMGIVPSNTGGFGAADTVAELFFRNEVAPLQRRFMQANEWVDDDMVRFQPYGSATR